MKQYKLAFLGFGNVGRALARLLAAKAGELREQHGIEFRVTGVASRRLGWLSNNTEGFEISGLLASPPSHAIAAPQPILTIGCGQPSLTQYLRLLHSILI